MELKISKTQMMVAIKILESRAAELDNVAMFRGIPATAFDKEHLVMICNLFADEWHKTQELYFAALDRVFPSYIAGGAAVSEILNKPSFWSNLWNKIKGSA